MATTVHSTSRRGVIGAVAALPALALSFAGTAAAASTNATDILTLAREAAMRRDVMLHAGVAYKALPVEGRLLAYQNAKYEYEAAIEDLLDAAEEAH